MYLVVLEEVVVFDFGMIECYYCVDVVVFLVEVIMYDCFVGGVGEIVVGGNGLFGLYVVKDVIVVVGGIVLCCYLCIG